MLKENLAMLRSINGYSQEEIAEKIHISRQAYAKWESGATVPDIEKCCLLADIYGITLDQLINNLESSTSTPIIVPQGKNIWGSATINDRGQIVIPKGAREKFNLTGGTRMIVLSDETGIALLSAETFEKHMQEIMKLASMKNEEE